MRRGLARTLLTAALVLLLAVGGWLAFTFVGRDRGTPVSERPALWKPPVRPWEPDHCERRPCRPLAALSVGPSDLVLLVDPELDDAVAQWGDCVDQFRSCVDRLQDPTAASVHACMANATACPAPCREAFRRPAGDASDLAGLLAAFSEVYLDLDAPCLPSSP